MIDIFVTFGVTSQEYAKFLRVAYDIGAIVTDVTLQTFSSKFTVKVTAEAETITYLKLIYNGRMVEDPIVEFSKISEKIAKGMEDSTWALDKNPRI